MKTTTVKQETPFEKALRQVWTGKLTPPETFVGSTKVDYFSFQFASHKFYMKIFAAGMTARQCNLKTYKTYYGLTAKSAKDCLVQFEAIEKDYLDKIAAFKQKSNIS